MMNCKRFGVIMLSVCFLTVAGYSQNTSLIHTVEKGNTLYNVSRKYNISIEDIKRWNQLKSNHIKMGQQLSIHFNELASSDVSNITKFNEDIFPSNPIFNNPLDGKCYNTIVNNDLIWMIDNLNYRQGDAGLCYDNEDLFCKNYGKLYSGYESAEACPKGWRLPTKFEWIELFDQYGLEILTFGGEAHPNQTHFEGLGEVAYYWTAETRANSKKWQTAVYVSRSQPDVIMSLESQRSYSYSCRCVRELINETPLIDLQITLGKTSNPDLSRLK